VVAQRAGRVAPAPHRRVDPHLLELDRLGRPCGCLRLEAERPVLEPEPRTSLLDLGPRPPAKPARVATQRIDQFLFGQGDTFQTDNAMRTLTAGGLFGMGPGAGTRKFGLPEPHTDYIFSVIGEEFGLIACLAIALLYLTIIARVLVKLLEEDSPFAILAAAGLVIQFGLQALINMAVNVQIAPSKGMTLPFISYGGSSMLALSIGMGLLLAFTRRNPYLTRSPYVVKWSGEQLTT